MEDASLRRPLPGGRGSFGALVFPEELGVGAAYVVGVYRCGVSGGLGGGDLCDGGGQVSLFDYRFVLDEGLEGGEVRGNELKVSLPGVTEPGRNGVTSSGLDGIELGVVDGSVDFSAAGVEKSCS